ncbi:uncharacterized protein LOC121390352 isoform X2 [Gigantopelta aegis]|nr:uncharacterized protein LOC121390352 isoform X2 [Gigantopelta aegis]
MEDAYEKLLSKCRPKLVKTIAGIKPLLDELESRDTLNREMIANILAKIILQDQIRALLDILPRRPQEAFDDFYFSLEEVDESSSVAILREQLDLAGLPIPQRGIPEQGAARKAEVSRVSTKNDEATRTSDKTVSDASNRTSTTEGARKYPVGESQQSDYSMTPESAARLLEKISVRDNDDDADQTDKKHSITDDKKLKKH